MKRIHYSWPTEYAISLIDGRWKVLIILKLSKGKKRFNELHRILPGVTKKMLIQQLRDLEEDSLVHRHVYHQVPPKVEYSLTDRGEQLRPILKLLDDWGKVLKQENSENESEEWTEQNQQKVLFFSDNPFNIL